MPNKTRILALLAAGGLLATTACAPAPAAAPAASGGSAAKPPAASGASFDEKAVADFYKGKTVRIIVGFGPGGSHDIASRLLAKQLPKYIPGNPNVIVENKPGAVSMAAANDVYRVQPKDGTVVANFNSNLVMLQALGQPGVEYDARKFQWLGSMADSPNACIVRTDAGINSFEEVVAGKELIVGATGQGSNTYDLPAALRGALGANIKIVPGYDGTAKMRLALENKEVDGICYTWSEIKATADEWLQGDKPFAKVLVVAGDKAPDHPWMKGVPAAETLAKTPEAKQMLAAVAAPALMATPYAVAPEVPRDRVLALRQAFARAAADKDLLAEAEKAKLEIGPSTAEQVEARVQQLLDTPPDIVARLKDVLK